MKKLTIITAFAALAALSGLASAQSNVTVFGVIDLSVNSVTNGSNRLTTMDANQQSTSRLGFRGTENLGNGNTASFWLESTLDPSSGMAGASKAATINKAETSSGQLFDRRATLSLENATVGELRLGRDYVPTYRAFQSFDAFAANGLMEGWTLANNTLGSNISTMQRASNSVSYFLPSNLNGIYGQATVSSSEGLLGQKYTGARLGYAVGKADIAVSYGNTANGAADLTVTNVGASYDFGMIKVFGIWNQNKYDTKKETLYELSGSIPVGADEVKVGYAHAAFSNYASNSDVGQFGAQYLHNLSKRTAVYTGFGRMINSGKGNFTLGGTTVATSNDLTSTGYNVGVRHIF